MTKLLMIDVEARRILGRLPPPQLQALRTSLIALCDAAWPEIRGPEPASGLAKALWEIPPHLANIFLRLYGNADKRLIPVLGHLAPAQALALLALAEIERGDAEGARSAYAEMRRFESPEAGMAHVQAMLSHPGGHAPGARLRHAHRPALWRAVVGLALQTGRWDSKAVLECIRLVAQAQAAAVRMADEPDMAHILDMLRELGVSFLCVSEDLVSYAVRGEEKAPFRRKQLAEMLAEGWQTQGD